MTMGGLVLIAFLWLVSPDPARCPAPAECPRVHTNGRRIATARSGSWIATLRSRLRGELGVEMYHMR